MNGFDLIIEPDADDPDAAQVFVDGTIADRPSRFLLDTGSPLTCIGLDDLTRSFLDVDTHHSGGIFGARLQNRIVRAPTIEIGSLTRANFQVVLLDEVGDSPRNLVGMDLLREQVIRVSYADRRVDIGPETWSPDLAQNTLFMDSTDHIYVDIRIGSSNAPAVWDSGAGITIVDQTFLQLHPECFRRTGSSTGTDSTGAKMETESYLMSNVTIGGVTFPSHSVAAVDLSEVNARIERPMDLILGYSTQRLADWRFDFPNLQWSVELRQLPD